MAYIEATNALAYDQYNLESSLQSSPNECRSFGGKKVDWLSDMLSLYTIYYSAVASNLLRLAISRAILSDQPELVLYYLTSAFFVVRTCINKKNSIEFWYSTFLLV